MTHPGGAPRTVSPPKEEMILLGEEMIKWIKEHNPCHLSYWYCGEKGIIYNHWRALRKLPEFVPYYEKALMMIGQKYLKKDSEIEPSLKQRFLRLYFKDLKEIEDQDAQEAAARTKDIESARPQQVIIEKWKPSE